MDGRPAEARPEPLGLARTEDEHAEPCPNCGAALAGPRAVVCVACGYDLAAVRTRETVVGRPVVVAAGSGAGAEAGAGVGAAAAGAIGRSAGTATTSSSRDGTGSGDPRSSDDTDSALPAEPLAAGAARIPLILAGVAVLLLLGAYLGGLSGVFERRDGLYLDADGGFTAAEPSWLQRFVELGRFAVRFGLLWIAASLGIALVGYVRHRPIGELATFAARVASVVATVALISLLALDRHVVEQLVEAALAAGAFVGLTMLWFRFAAMDALQAAVATIVLVVAVWLAAVAVVWVGVW